VGSISSQSGLLAADFAPVVDGVRAYLDMTNAHGGVDGRKIDLRYALDDQSNPTEGNDLARTLVEQDHVFAVVGVATAFTGFLSYFSQLGVPTFGYTISKDWQGPPQLFGALGSTFTTSSGEGEFAYAAKSLGARRVGVLAYDIPQSAGGCQSAITGMSANGIKVAYQDLSVGLGGNLTPDAIRMRDAGVDFVFSCLQESDNISLSRALHQNGMGSVTELWLEIYDRSELQAEPGLMNGVYFFLQHVPFEAANTYPGTYPGMAGYIDTMQRYEPASTYDELALYGWLNADLFVQGLRAVGPHLTQARLVAAINKLRSYNGGGLVPPVDWAVAHTQPFAGQVCAAFVQARDGAFHPVLTHGKSVFTCFEPRGTSDEPLPTLPGTPGA
jgi:branched-chain amino acid transport system substrate-binding protein